MIQYASRYAKHSTGQVMIDYIVLALSAHLVEQTQSQVTVNLRLQLNLNVQVQL